MYRLRAPAVCARRFAAFCALLSVLPILACGEDDGDGMQPPASLDTRSDSTRPDRIDSAEADAPGPSGGDAQADGGALADGAAGESGTPADAGEAGAPAALALSALTPATATRGQAVNLAITGTGLAPGVRLLFDGQPQPATRVSDTRLEAQVPAERTGEAGFHAVWVELDGADGIERSNLVYLTVPAPRGWPEVTDFRPDSAMPGEKIRIAGFNLSGPALEITDAAGHRALSGVIGTINTPQVVLEAVEFTVPMDWQSGPIAVANASGRFLGKVFNVGRNLAQLPGVKLTASSEYGGDWTIARGADNDLYTSWFTAAGDCVSAGPTTCMTVPWFTVSFAGPQTVGRIAVRGNREYTSGYDFLRARLEVLGDGGAVLWSAAYELPQPDRDLDVVLPRPVSNAAAVRFTSEKDESEDPGLGELEVFAP
jgi:IPT/TIG domain